MGESWPRACGGAVLGGAWGRTEHRHPPSAVPQHRLTDMGHRCQQRRWPPRLFLLPLWPHHRRPRPVCGAAFALAAN